MEQQRLRQLLEAVQRGERTVEEALHRIELPSTADLGFARLDLQRQRRTGHPEAIYGEGKSADQLIPILERLAEAGQDGLVTRVSPDKAELVLAAIPAVNWHPVAGILHLSVTPPRPPAGELMVVCAGTSDLPVAEEAAVTAEVLGNNVVRLRDVGVAGIHRVLGQVDVLRSARVVVVVAGMEGALASVVAGLVAVPVIAVPTSVGYGAAFGGLAALLGMLNSCAPGVSVVNIDNGYGAALQATRINQPAGARP